MPPTMILSLVALITAGFFSLRGGGEEAEAKALFLAAASGVTLSLLFYRLGCSKAPIMEAIRAAAGGLSDPRLQIVEFATPTFSSESSPPNPTTVLSILALITAGFFFLKQGGEEATAKALILVAAAALTLSFLLYLVGSPKDATLRRRDHHITWDLILWRPLEEVIAGITQAATGRAAASVPWRLEFFGFIYICQDVVGDADEPNSALPLQTPQVCRFM